MKESETEAKTSNIDENVNEDKSNETGKVNKKPQQDLPKDSTNSVGNTPSPKKKGKKNKKKKQSNPTVISKNEQNVTEKVQLEVSKKLKNKMKKKKKIGQINNKNKNETKSVKSNQKFKTKNKSK